MLSAGHGGECCGINHIYGFYRQSKNQTLRLLKDNIYQRKKERSSGLIEVVLTDAQAIKYDESLIRHKFFRINRFLNSNSGNYCNVYHLRTGQNWFFEAGKRGVASAVLFYVWRELKTLFYVTVSASSILLIHKAVSLMQKIV